MSRVMTFGGRRSCTASIQRPDSSVKAAKFSRDVSISVSNRPMALAEAAPSFTARPPTSWRITGTPHSRSASLTSSYPARRGKTDWRRKPAIRCRPFRPVRISESRPAAMSVKPRASSSSRCSSNPPSELIAEPRNSTLTERSNSSRRGPDSASPVTSFAKSSLHLR